MPSAKPDLEELLVPDADAWRAWLEQHHSDSPGVWLVLHKKGGEVTSLTYAQALDDALCFGWIDGQVRKRDDHSYVQRMTPRRKGSSWSARNVGYIERLESEGRMHAAGRAAVEAAKANGEWDKAYDGSATATVPEDLQAAIDADPAAKATFATLNAANRYSLIYRTNATKTTAGRARSIARAVERLARGETPRAQ